MRSSIAVAAFAAGALAVPFAQVNKRDADVVYDIVYVTDVVTVTAPYGSKETDDNKHYGHHNHNPIAYTTVVQQAASTPKYEAPALPLTTYAPKVELPSYTEKEESGPAPTDYEGRVIYHHNLHRANHSVPDVKWSDELYQIAKQIADGCVYAHDTETGGGGYGQNIAAGVEPANISAIITDLFYNGEEPYFSGQYGLDDPDMGMFEKWGHFTQIVWKGTTEVACATSHCPSGLANVGSGVSPYFTVCNYKSPGNYAGEYGSNVLKPLGKASASWNQGE